MAPDEQMYLVEIFAESGLDRWRVIDGHELLDMVYSAASDRDYDKFNAWSLEDGQKPNPLDVADMIDAVRAQRILDDAHARWYSSPGNSGRI